MAYLGHRFPPEGVAFVALILVLLFRPQGSSAGHGDKGGAGMYVATILQLLLIYALLTLSLNLVVGLAGQVNLGHAAFFGIGAYVGGTLLKAGAPFLLALAAGAVAATALGLVLGAVSLRLRGDYLAIATIAFNFAVVAAFLYTPYFGGAYGLSGIPRGLAPSTYVLALLATFGLAVFIHERVRNSESGYASWPCATRKWQPKRLALAWPGSSWWRLPCPPPWPGWPVCSMRPTLAPSDPKTLGFRFP